MGNNKCIFGAVIAIIVLCTAVLSYEKVFTSSGSNQGIESQEGYAYIGLVPPDGSCGIGLTTVSGRDGRDKAEGAIERGNSANFFNGYKYYADGLVLKQYPYSVELNSGDSIAWKFSESDDMERCNVVLVDFENEILTDISAEVEYEIKRHGIYALYVVTMDENGQENWENIMDKATVSTMYSEDIMYGGKNSFGFIPLNYEVSSACHFSAK